jgi:ABC transport system ATP-binding/permease protein
MEEIRRLESELADPDLFRRDLEAFAACTDRLARAQPNWEGAEERWLGLASHREQVA